MPNVSIVLPVYNGEDRIKKSVESIINQTYLDYELIIVDDCSTDDTYKIVSGMAERDKRIKVYKNKQNMKLPNSLNEGFKYAKGKYLTWTSDDNYYAPNAIEEMVNYLSVHEDVDMVYCDMKLIDGNDIFIRENQLGEPELMVHNNCVGACFMYTSKIAKSVGMYDANLFLAEDYDYWLRIYEKGKVAHIKKILYSYRLHEKSLTSTKLEEVKRMTVTVWMKHLDFIMNKIGNDKELFHFFDVMISFVEGNRRNEILRILFHNRKKYRFYYMRRNPRTFIKYLKGIKVR